MWSPKISGFLAVNAFLVVLNLIFAMTVWGLGTLLLPVFPGAWWAIGLAALTVTLVFARWTIGFIARYSR